MLEYEWANSAAMLLSYDPSAEEPAEEQPHHPHHQLFPLYDRSFLEVLPGTLYPSPPLQPASMAAPSSEEDYPPVLQHYSVSLPPGPAQPPTGPAMRIGLNLGVRTYFSSSPDGELMQLGKNVYQRSGGNAEGGALGGGAVVANASRARCQAEGCGADLTRAKHYHRRHKVCEFHSKAAAVVAHGLTQRFCQQCSRFHVLSEFDQGKRSCRKRLADHNRRRRKTQPVPALLPTLSSQTASDTAVAPAATVTGQNVAATKPSSEGASPGACGGDPVTVSAALVPPASPTRMALGRCFPPPDGVPGAKSSSSSSSPSSCSSSSGSSSSSVLPHSTNYHPYDRQIPMSIWDGSARDERAH